MMLSISSHNPVIENNKNKVLIQNWIWKKIKGPKGIILEIRGSNWTFSATSNTPSIFGAFFTLILILLILSPSQ